MDGYEIQQKHWICRRKKTQKIQRSGAVVYVKAGAVPMNWWMLCLVGKAGTWIS